MKQLSFAAFLLLAFVAAMRSEAQQQALSEAKNGLILREIYDPATHTRWLLMRDPEHPGGPGRLIQESEQSAPSEGKSKKNAELEPPQKTEKGIVANSPEQRRTEKAVSVIHSGDKVIVEDHTAVSSVYLEAVAMSDAAYGAPFEVQLKVNVGRKQLRVQALGPGRARIQF